MHNLKKFDVLVSPSPDGFIAQVVRRRTAQGATIEDSKTGFVTSEEAEAWGKSALADYLSGREEKKDARRQKRADAQVGKNTTPVFKASGRQGAA